MASRQTDHSRDVGLKLENVTGYKGKRSWFSLVTDEKDPLWRGGTLEEEEDRKRNPDSVNVKSASLYLFGCCLYNSFCCFLPKRIGSGSCSFSPGPWLGDKFCCTKAICCKLTMRRDRWLWLLHLVCFSIHMFFTVFTYIAAMDGDMSLHVVRIREDWARNEKDLTYTTISSSHQILYIDLLTIAFFGCSASMHGLWVFIGGFEWSKPFLWSKLDDCLCWWRWLEYSVSASLMMVAIATVTGLREQNTLFSIFFLTMITMCCGFFTEMVSRPAKNTDGTPNYERWEGDPELPPDGGRESSTLASVRLRARIKNYVWRMLPHALGVLPYSAAWAIIINNWLERIDDLCEKLRELMPDWVPWVIYGCCLMFSLFTFVQWRYQWTAPKHYWRTEVWYCVLSATSKVFLGWLLLTNVIMREGAEEAMTSRNFTDPTDDPIWQMCNPDHDRASGM